LIYLQGQVDQDTDGNRFGWENFVAASRESKLNYVGLLLHSALCEITNDETAHEIVEAITGAKTRDGWIDHGSVYTLPLSWDRRGIDWKFYWQLQGYLLRKGIVILGGNDNDEEPHPLLLSGEHKRADIPLPKDSNSSLIARHDELHNYWTLYNAATGGKIRFSFDNQDMTVWKASTPELVDVKITGFCTHGCKYCYQGSGVDGLHAAKQDLYRLATALKELQVFEVAIGGGEPTLHPLFNQFVERLAYLGVTPNFSTRNLNWFHVPKNRELLDRIGGFALSVDTYQEVEELAVVLDMYGIDHGKASIQVVDKVLSKYELSWILRRANEHDIRVTLLGFKDISRGAGFNNSRNARWIDVITDARTRTDPLPRIGIDTALAQEYQAELNERDVPCWMYSVREGGFSMYVDAVGKQAGRSSYEPGTFTPLADFEAKTILAAFDSYGEGK